MTTSLAELLGLSLALGLVAGCAATDPLGSSDATLPAADAQIAPPFNHGVSTLAGAASIGSADGDRDQARFANPVNVAYGPNDSLYVADFDGGKIRVVDLAGNVKTVVSQVGFQRPFGLAFAPDHTLYVSTDNDDTGAHDLVSGTVWRVDINANTATVVARRIGRPRGMTVLATGGLVLSDDLHHVVETLDPATGKVVIIAGTWDQPGMVNGVGAAARFSAPYGVVDRGDGSVVLADYGNDRIRTVTLATGAVETLAGSGTPEFRDGAVATAGFDHPQAIAIDASGTLYVTDTFNYRVRRIHNGMVDTVAGDGTGGYIDADDRLAAELYGLEGLCVSADGGMVFVADGSRGCALPYNRLRQVMLEL